MLKKNFLLLADTSSICDRFNQFFTFVSVFPGLQKHDTYCASYWELRNRAKLESIFYKKFIPRIFHIISSQLEESLHIPCYLYRPLLVSLTSIYISRVISIAHAIKRLDRERIYVGRVNYQFHFNGLDNIRGIESDDFEFNQSLVHRISIILGVSKVVDIGVSDYNLIQKPKPQKNMLFRPSSQSKLHSFFIRLQHLFFNCLKKLPNRFARFTSLGLGGDDYWLTKHGFYFPFGIFNYQDKFSWSSDVRDPFLRKNLIPLFDKDIGNAVSKLIHECSSFQLSREECTRLGHEFSSYLSDCIPVRYLEGLQNNFKHALKQRKSVKSNLLIGSALLSDKGIFLMSATKYLGGKVFGVQHGGHYGYIDSHSTFAELEYSCYDYMITYGWDEFDSHLPITTAIPLPSPRLSSKILDFELNHMTTFIKERQVLFLPNFLRLYPPVGTCGQTRPEFNYEILDSQKKLIIELTSSQINVDLKPYSQSIALRLEHQYNHLRQTCRGRFNLIESSQKGLSSDLISQYNILLWDQIGTGTLDCFVQSIPAMVYWKKIYSRESVFAFDLLKDLEFEGVLHSSLDTLIQEIRIYLDSPVSWMNSPSRIQAITTFCHQYARTNKNWNKLWMNTLRQSPS